MPVLHRGGRGCLAGVYVVTFNDDRWDVQELQRLPAQDSQVGKFNQPHGFIDGLRVVMQAQQPAAHFLRELGDDLKNMLATRLVRVIRVLE